MDSLILHARFCYRVCTVAPQMGLRHARNNYRANNFIVIRLIVSHSSYNHYKVMHIGAHCLGYIKHDFLPQTATYLICGIACTVTRFQYASPRYYDVIIRIQVCFLSFEFDFIYSKAQIFSQIGNSCFIRIGHVNFLQFHLFIYLNVTFLGQFHLKVNTRMNLFRMRCLTALVKICYFISCWWTVNFVKYDCKNTYFAYENICPSKRTIFFFAFFPIVKSNEDISDA